MKWNRAFSLSLSLCETSNPLKIRRFPCVDVFPPQPSKLAGKIVVQDKFFSHPPPKLSHDPATFSNVEKSLSNPITPGSSLLRFHRGSAIAPSRNGCISRYFIVVSRWNFYNFSLHLLFQSLLAPELGAHAAVFKNRWIPRANVDANRRKGIEKLKINFFWMNYLSVNSYFYDTFCDKRDTRDFVEQFMDVFTRDVYITLSLSLSLSLIDW